MDELHPHCQGDLLTDHFRRDFVLESFCNYIQAVDGSLDRPFRSNGCNCKGSRVVTGDRELHTHTHGQVD